MVHKPGTGNQIAFKPTGSKMPPRMERLGALLGSEKTLGRFKQLVEKGEIGEASGAMMQLCTTANSKWSTRKAKASAAAKLSELCEAKVPKALFFVADGYTGAGAREMFAAVDGLKSVTNGRDEAFTILYSISLFTRFPEVALRAAQYFIDSDMTSLLVNIVLKRPLVTNDLEDPAVKAAFQKICRSGSLEEIGMVSGYAERVIANMKRHHNAERQAARTHGGTLPVQ